MKVSKMEDQIARAVAKRRLGAAVVALAAWLVSASATAVTMESIEFSSLPGDKTEIRMNFDSAHAESVRIRSRRVEHCSAILSTLKCLYETNCID